MGNLKPTEKQEVYVQRIVNHLGAERVEKYIRNFYPNIDMSNPTKQQAQKIITGLQSFMPRKHWGGNGMSLSWIQSQ